ncbi:MAG: hypothetical protein WC455_15670 [Dehalococcoidia bacterium]|jgi:hypothetical protein
MVEQEQPQVNAGEQAEVAAGADQHQPETETKQTQPGAEAKAITPEKAEKAEPEKKPKLYTEEEVRQREADITSKQQQQTEQWRRQALQQAMQQEIAKAQEAERQATAKDAEDVQTGVITQSDADRRQRIRQSTAEAEARLNQMRQQDAELTAKSNVAAKAVMAQEMGKEFELSDEDVKALITDKAITTPEMMIRRAAKLSQDNLKTQLQKAKVQPETFDKGPGDFMDTSNDNLSARDLARKAYSQKK